MALKATVYKAELSVSDMDRHHYATYALVLARHPSETERRLAVRLLAFALFADDQLAFTRGVSTPEEPDLWRKDLDGSTDLWIDLGQPDERRIRQAVSRAKRVVIVSYNDAAAAAWRDRAEPSWTRFDDLSIVHVPDRSLDELEALIERTMQVQCSIDGGQVWFSSNRASVEVALDWWRR